MMFEELLGQAVAMLQRRGCVAYRALQAQFQIDDSLLDILIKRTPLGEIEAAGQTPHVRETPTLGAGFP